MTLPSAAIVATFQYLAEAAVQAMSDGTPHVSLENFQRLNAEFSIPLILAARDVASLVQALEDRATALEARVAALEGP